MSIIFLTILIFVDILKWIIIISVILSWLNIKIKFIDNILEPVYEFIEKYLPLKLGPISFTPIVLILILYFISGLIFIYEPSIKQQYLQLINF